jgi:long-chain acyl-CoA synthetase
MGAAAPSPFTLLARLRQRSAGSGSEQAVRDLNALLKSLLRREGALAAAPAAPSSGGKQATPAGPASRERESSSTLPASGEKGAGPAARASRPGRTARTARSAAERRASGRGQRRGRTAGRSGETELDAFLELLADGRLDKSVEAGLDLDTFASLGDHLAGALEGGDRAAAKPTPLPGGDGTTTDPASLPEQVRARTWLDVVRRPAILRRIDATGRTGEWMDLILRVIEASRFTVARLLAQRVERYGPRTLFREVSGGQENSHTWIEVAARVDRIALGFLSLFDEYGRAPIAILSENRYEMALVDLACLSTGLVDVMIPAPATDSDVAHILENSGAGFVVASTEEQRRKVERFRSERNQVKAVVQLDRASPGNGNVLSLAKLIARGKSVAEERLRRERDAIELDDLATLMYTSGTTGKPKGIRFSQRNVVSKRFARALAIPDIGERDVFLCYLPLFHTFGRFLELMGSIFWGATYVFLENPSIEMLRETMLRVRPTVFVSVPRKWIQLWEEIGRRADLEEDPDEALREVTRQVVGDRLRWGLSAAGYLAPEIFRFFQRQGVELMSGFGMTEATGGITMTPPGRYRDDTLGLRLPGIEVQLDTDGEMMIRGPYVMVGYHESPEGSGIEEGGWFRTGDLMERDDAGYFRLVDRKKEIYKNIQGQSVAPQRVENLFRDFDAVKRVFLIGDHKPYNTVLFVPNPDYEEIDLRAMSPGELRDYFRSLVVSVNGFLAPFERIVDFDILDRDFEEEREELTPKGTYRRKAIERSFASEIDFLYRRAHLSSEGLGVEIHVPNSLFQSLGLTAGDVKLRGDELTLAPTGARLTVRKISEDARGRVVQIGAWRYLVRRRVVDLGALLTSPALWLGNEELAAFTGLDDAARTRRLRPPSEVTPLGRVAEYQPTPAALVALRRAANEDAPTLEAIDLAARMLGSGDEEHGLLALRVIGKAVRGEEGMLLETSLLALRSAADSSSLVVRRRAFQLLLPVERDSQTAATLERFLRGAEALLDEASIRAISEQGISDAKLRGFVDRVHALTEQIDQGDEQDLPTLRALLRFLAEYGGGHPAKFEILRSVLARVQAFTRSPSAHEEAGLALAHLTEGFRTWLGPVQRIAVDPDRGEEYRWEDVVTFEEEIAESDRLRILDAFSHTSVLREFVYLFSSEALLRLADFPPGGIWVSRLAEKPGKSGFRVTAHTRIQGSFDFVLNVNRGQSRDEIAEEAAWLLVTAGNGVGDPLVEKFGGYWSEFDVWTEGFTAGETLERVVQRLARRQEGDLHDRLGLLWPYLVASAASAYLEFWNRTGRRYALVNPSPADVIVPTHDYQTGTRILDISDRHPAPELERILDDLWERLVVPLERAEPQVDGLAGPEVVLSAFLETIGVTEGLSLLRGTETRVGPVSRSAPEYVRQVEAAGFVHRRIGSAVDRYHRWVALAADAPPAAQAKTLAELYDTYRLADLLKDYPDARVRFFRRTVFRDAPEPLARGLDGIIDTLRRTALDRDEIIDRLSALRVHMEPGSPEEYFLARLTYPHLQPGDEADFLSTEMGGVRQTDIVVSLADNQGRLYHVRQPVNPKEIGRLHRLFLTARLDVQFRPEHSYLIAVSERGSLMGGIFYELDEENRTAHLEKIVVAERYRKLGVSDGLMNEFFNRLRAAGAETVTTGFFRPSYFYRFGFSVGKLQAGLVKTL